MINQAVIGWHDHASECGSCLVNLTNDNWNETFRVPIRATVDHKIDGDFNGSMTIKMVAGGNVKHTLKLEVSSRKMPNLNPCLAEPCSSEVPCIIVVVVSSSSSSSSSNSSTTGSNRCSSSSSSSSDVVVILLIEVADYYYNNSNYYLLFIYL